MKLRLPLFFTNINHSPLAGKEVIGLGFDKSTGHAYINVYGDAYIGAKDESTYIRYTQKGGVDIKGMFHIEQGSTGWRNMEGLPDEIQAAADLAQKAQDAIDNAAVGSVNLLRNSGLPGIMKVRHCPLILNCLLIPNYIASN